QTGGDKRHQGKGWGFHQSVSGEVGFPLQP
ncbi:MAG: hypothetical protein RLZZ214_2415, partial [Verrucomicrobiota bacterium]